MTQILKQSTAVDVLIGPFVDSGDGYTAETGLSPSVKLSKNGQTLAAKNDATTPAHDADGYYNCELDATDTNTLGTLTLTVVGSATSLPVRHEFQVLDAISYNAIYSTGTFITNADLGLWLESTISTVNTQQSLDLTESITLDDEWIGHQVTIEDVSTGDFHETWITDVIATNDRIIINEAAGFTVVTSDIVRIYKDKHPRYELNDYDPATGTEATNILSKLLRYVQLILRKDAGIATDNSAELTDINADGGSGSGTFDNTTDSLEAEHDVNVAKINSTTVLGTGVTGDLWRG
jgi:hypothetical protein